MNLQRLEIYQNFLALGGIFSEKTDFSPYISSYSITKEKNQPVLTVISKKLLRLKEKDKERFFQLLKLLLIDNYDFLDCIYGGSCIPEDAPEHVLEIYAKMQERDRPLYTLKEIFDDSVDIHQLDKSLEENGYLSSVENLIVGSVMVAHSAMQGVSIGQKYLEILNTPKHVKVLMKYFKKEEFLKIYHEAFSYAVKQEKRKVLFNPLWETFDYSFHVGGLTKEEALRDVYELHLYLLNNFKAELDETYYFEIARETYKSLLLNINAGIITEEYIVQVVHRMENETYLIDDVKNDLMPKGDNGQDIPLLFQLFILYHRDLLAPIVLDEESETEVSNLVSAFELKFDSMYKRLNKTMPKYPNLRFADSFLGDIATYGEFNMDEED